MTYKCALGVVGALALGAAVVTPARAVTLQDLINNGTPVVAGDKIFSSFSSGGTLAASNITVNFVNSSGVQFTGNWNTLTPGANNAVIGYTVSVAPGSDNISGANLFFAGQVIVNNAKATVGETLTDTVHGKDYSLQVSYDGPEGATDHLRSSVTIDPSVTTLKVIKSIDVAADGPNSFASINFVENTFLTTPTGGGVENPIPEPMSLALLPLGLAGLALRKKLAH